MELLVFLIIVLVLDISALRWGADSKGSIPRGERCYQYARLTAQMAGRARAEGWRHRELETSHSPETDAPDEVTRLLLELT